jgi:hypothetical protein
MNNLPFPWLALGMGLLVAFGLLGSGALGPSESWKLPMLTLLVVTEFGFFVTAIGAGVGINTLLANGRQTGLLLATIACSLLACALLLLGIRLWPGGFSL